MLVHVTATHEPRHCPVALAPGTGASAYTQTIGRVTDPEAARLAQVTVHSALVSSPNHTIFLTLEVKEGDQLTQFLAPLRLIGNCDISIVSDLNKQTL